MKKELLMASALVSTLGVASVAQAVTASMSGSHLVGQEFESSDSSTDTNSTHNASSFSVSLSETTDGGTTISSSFMLQNEGGGLDNDTSLTLAFSDGSKLELLNAGNASGTHDIAIPGAAGEQGLTITTTANAPSGLDFATPATTFGLEWHSAADFMMDGLKVSASYSADNEVAKSTTAATSSAWGVGATYVTTAGDTTVTVSGGVADGEIATGDTQATSDKGGFNVGVVAVTGDLTIGVGYGDGDTFVNSTTNGSNQEIDGSVMKAGISYKASDDLTLALGVKAGEGKDGAFGTPGTTDDSTDSTSASVTYTVASGVSAVVGYTTVDAQNEGSSTTDDGSSWYIGASMSF
jgi:hypothetical protein